ncbi:MAG TPA: NYN domain-containing protein [Solirubrobacterales bacterium]
MTRWIVDGMNVIGSRPDGWWRDREGAKRRLAAELVALAERGDEVTVVFDGSEPEEPLGAPGVTVLFAPGGPNAADDRIAQLVAADGDPASLTVVTADADLVRRVTEQGAATTGARSLRRELPN